MKKPLISVLLSLPLLSFAGRAPEAVLNEVSQLPEAQFSRVCGNLLTGMAIAGQTQYIKNVSAEMVDKRALATAQAAILLLSLDPKPDPAVKASNRQLANEVEELSPQAHINVLSDCLAWLDKKSKEGAFSAPLMAGAYEIAVKQLTSISIEK